MLLTSGLRFLRTKFPATSTLSVHAVMHLSKVVSNVISSMSYLSITIKPYSIARIRNDIILPPIFSLMPDIRNEPFCDSLLACPHLSAIPAEQSAQFMSVVVSIHEGGTQTYRADKAVKEVFENVWPKRRGPTSARSKHICDECIRNVEFALSYACEYGRFQSGVE